MCVTFEGTQCNYTLTIYIEMRYQQQCLIISIGEKYQVFTNLGESLVFGTLYLKPNILSIMHTLNLNHESYSDRFHIAVAAPPLSLESGLDDGLLILTNVSSSWYVSTVTLSCPVCQNTDLVTLAMNITTGNFVIPLPKVFSSTSDKLILVAVTNTCEQTWNGRVGMFSFSVYIHTNMVGLVALYSTGECKSHSL